MRSIKVQAILTVGIIMFNPKKWRITAPGKDIWSGNFPMVSSFQRLHQCATLPRRRLRVLSDSVEISSRAQFAFTKPQQKTARLSASFQEQLDAVCVYLEWSPTKFNGERLELHTQRALLPSKEEMLNHFSPRCFPPPCMVPWCVTFSSVFKWRSSKQDFPDLHLPTLVSV